MSTIYLIRHGQAAFSSADYDQLTPLGIAQAQALGPALRRRLPGVDHVISGTLKRHRQTAEHCLNAMALPAEWEQDAGFNEYPHDDILDGLMDRKAFVETVKTAPDRKKAFEQLFSQAMQRWQAGAHDDDYSERWPEFRDRCRQALERLCERLQAGQTALVFTSGGVISLAVQGLLKLPEAEYAPLNWRLVNAGITKLTWGRGGLSLSTLNEHAHFEGELGHLLTYR